MPPHENFEIFNAKSCILSITERVNKLLFENILIFLTLFFFSLIINLRFESK